MPSGIPLEPSLAQVRSIKDRKGLNQNFDAPLLDLSITTRRTWQTIQEAAGVWSADLAAPSE